MRKVTESSLTTVFREINLGGKNYERSIIPVRSGISRFFERYKICVRTVRTS